MITTGSYSRSVPCSLRPSRARLSKRSASERCRRKAGQLKLRWTCLRSFLPPAFAACRYPWTTSLKHLRAFLSRDFVGLLKHCMPCASGAPAFVMLHHKCLPSFLMPTAMHFVSLHARHIHRYSKCEISANPCSVSTDIRFAVSVESAHVSEISSDRPAEKSCKSELLTSVEQALPAQARQASAPKCCPSAFSLHTAHLSASRTIRGGMSH